eukprot:Nitzschia sp. Nitz4//scaffold7_size249615//186556//187413//NITZ4_001198-RA/size249615-processed-gene-0.206-mRNA-1//-1//CDS//3329558505//7596//frame0
MGLPMATNLSKNRPVLAFDLNDEAMSQACDQGISTAQSVEEVVLGSSTIVTMLPSIAAGDAVVKQILATNADPRTIVDCSTVDPSTSRQWNESLEDAGHVFVDAPVSGGVTGAQNATLTFMVGTNQEDLVEEHVRPLLESMGRRVVVCGGPGSGSAVKLCNNLAVSMQMGGVCEAMNLGDALGVDPVVLASVMNSSTGKSWSCDTTNPHPAVAALNGAPASKGYSGGFGTDLMLKDVTMAVAAGEKANVSLPLGTVARDLFQQVSDSGLGQKDFGVLLQFLNEKK